MIKIISTIFLLVLGKNVFSQTCRIQFIHNCADTSSSLIDIYVGGILKADNLPFRFATPFMDVTAGADITIAVAPHTSVSETEAFYTNLYTFVAAEKYIMVANGEQNPNVFNPYVPFSLALFTGAIETGTSSATTEVLFCQGTPDAPLLDFSETDLIQLTAFEDVPYNSFAGYQSLLTANYTFTVADQNGVGAFGVFGGPFDDLNLGALGVTIVSSGFLNQSVNNNSAAFGLWMAIPTGGALIQLPVIELNLFARTQIIHNSADAGAGVVDIYLNGELALNDFMFRTATSYFDMRAGQNVEIAIAAGNSADASDAFYVSNQYLFSGQTYCIVADGIISDVGYFPMLPFQLYVREGAIESSPISGDTFILVHHGATDAFTIDIRETAIFNSTLLEDIAYSEFSSNFSVPSDDYVFQVTDASGLNAVESYLAPFLSNGQSGASLTILASGFLDPAMNSSGPAFGLWVADANGGDLIPLEIVPAAPVYAQLQLIHSCADGMLALADVYLNDELLLNDFSFRNATLFQQVEAGNVVTISVAENNSVDVGDALASFDFTFDENENYIGVLSGILSASGYNPAPAFSIEMYSGASENSMNSGETDILVFHGSTDAPTIDVVDNYAPLVLSNDLGYNQFEGYASLDASIDHVIDITNGNGSVNIGNYTLPLNVLSLDGEAATLFVSGFLNPLNNLNGPALEPWIVMADGTTQALPLHVGIDDNDFDFSLRLYPNPADEIISFNGKSNQQGRLSYAVYNAIGEKVSSEKSLTLSSKFTGRIETGDLINGLYTLRLSGMIPMNSYRFLIAR